MTFPRPQPTMVFIVGQALMLGVELAFLIVPGNAVFLTTYGAGNLPFVYLAVAALGAVVSFGLTGLQARRRLFQLAIGSTLIVALLTLSVWALLAIRGLQWVSAGALILFALQVQLGFVHIGAQAGRRLAPIWWRADSRGSDRQPERATVSRQDR